MRFSVISVNYNNRQGLDKTIKSVVEQKSFNDFEYIIIDGASTDGSVDIIMKYSDSINFWVSEPDEGIYDAMNKGVSVAKGDYCIFMNSGDCFYGNKVLYDVSKIMNEHVDFIAGNYCIKGKVYKSPDLVTAMTLFKTIDVSICHQALFTKREILIKNPYQINYKIISDYINQFDSLIFDNATYQYVDIIICEVEPDGLSATNYKLLSIEKESYLKKVLPKRIFDDYITFMSIKIIESRNHELYSLLRKYNFSNIDLKITTCILKIVGFLKTVKIIFLKLFKY